MTYREKLMSEHPELVSDAYHGGAAQCPCSYGYEAKQTTCAMEQADDLLCTAEICRACWDREMGGLML